MYGRCTGTFLYSWKKTLCRYSAFTGSCTAVHQNPHTYIYYTLLFFIKISKSDVQPYRKARKARNNVVFSCTSEQLSVVQRCTGHRRLILPKRERSFRDIRHIVRIVSLICRQGQYILCVFVLQTALFTALKNISPQSRDKYLLLL